MIPGEIIVAEGVLTLNPDASVTTLMVANTGDRPVQVGSHYHFAECNGALEFDRATAHGHRLDIASGTAVRFEPGQRREVQLIPIGGARRVFGFNGQRDGRPVNARPNPPHSICCDVWPTTWRSPAPCRYRSDHRGGA